MRERFMMYLVFAKAPDAALRNLGVRAAFLKNLWPRTVAEEALANITIRPG